MSRTYSRNPCLLCKKDLSANGLAQNRHKMMHVRRGEMTVRKDREGYLVFEIVRKQKTDDKVN